MQVPASVLSTAGPADEPLARHPEPAATLLRWPTETARIAYGGDYNPEQWPEDVWHEDVALMREAGVNLVSIGIFSWALLEPAEGRYEFGWLDRVIELLHGAGIAVDLATPTAVPPAWFIHRYPQSRPVTREGHVLGGGARGTFCPSSGEYAAAAAGITEQLARRYGGHPALALWHVHNEYGAPVSACYCPASAAAFRRWLRERYSDLGALNQAWGTSFWGQAYGGWDEIEPPRQAPTAVNPAQQLDFMRFSSDELLACFRRERDILHRLSPGVPVTTNFMATTCKQMDYWRWAAEVDVVSNDHYLKAELADNHIDLAMAADLTRSLAGGRPWVLMEHSTSAVNWQPRNIAKRPGQMRRNSLTHVARGADGVLFFQWRAAAFGAEKFHSAMLPHGGTRTRIWRDVVSLGSALGSLREVHGSRVAADVAVVWDWPSWWALELDWRPSCDVTYRDRVDAYYASLWRSNLTVDFVAPEAPLDGYRLVVVPSLYLTTVDGAANLTRYVENGGTLVVSYFSGIVDANDAVHAGGHPGALRQLLGLSVEEFLPLPAGERVRLDNGSVADVWAEEIVPHGAESMATYVDGPAAGGPAITRFARGRGQAWYVSTRLGGADLDTLLRRVCSEAGITPLSDVDAGLEVVRRVADDATYVFAINHGDRDTTLAAEGTELLSGTACTATITVPAGEVRVIRQSPA
jgi:beta-galactosidase